MNRPQAKALDESLDSYQKVARQASERMGAESSGRAPWLTFAAAAGASLTSGTICDAAINHFIASPPIRAELFGSGVDIDLDEDGDNDVGFAAFVTSSGIYNTFVGLGEGLNNAQLIGDQLIRNQFISIKKFAQGAVIPAAAPAIVGSILHSMVTAYNTIIPPSPYGNWGVSDIGIAGFVDGPAGSRRAGWIKIRTESQGGILGAVEILEWAYESTPGVSILAGQGQNAAIPGDYDSNGSVGTEDYTKWKNDFGANVAAGTGADGNGNADVDAADYTVWRDNFGASGSASFLSAVPEPTTISLGMLALGAAGVTALRRR